jgi:hypothetical protein
MAAAGRDLASMADANSKVAAALAQDGRGRSPKRTGRLSRSVAGRAERGRVEVGSSLIYAGVIHNGWPRHHISPQPFLRESLEQGQQRWLGIYAEEAQSILGQVKGA